MIDIYRAGWQLTKVKALTLFTVPVAAGALYWGWDLLTSYGLRPADGGVLAPLWQRLLWAGFVAGFGLAILAGMWVYGRRYLARVRYDEAADALHVFTLEFLASRRRIVPAVEVLGGNYVDGRMEDAGVDAPWYFLHLKDRPVLVLDAQGVFPDRELAEKLLKIRLRRKR